ncbi:MAG TPA: CHAT domain-containing protein [Sphingomicrobium sp.]|nr:CHAT domain-containing protein [Sphingomicrobium sp.]
MNKTALVVAVALGGFATAASASTPLSVRDSWRIGNSGTSFCSAQSLTTDQALADMFDAGYSITCRDAALPIGKLYQLKDTPQAAARLAADRAERAICDPPRRESIAGLGMLDVIECRLKNANVAYRAYQLRRGPRIYAAQGLGGYDSALQLGLRSIIADEPLKGELAIATTGAGDPAAFARVQAGSLAPEKALEEAYRRNNVGSYAEAGEFFAAASQSSADAPLSRAEALVNEALQKSNLGRFAEADSLFAKAAGMVGPDAIVARRLRNYRTIHELNQGDAKGALTELDKPIPMNVEAARDGAKGALVIDEMIANRLNAESKIGQQLAAQSDELLPDEKAEILDGQAMQLRGTALRLTGDRAGARDALQRADSELLAVRGGKVASILWMRAQIFGDLGTLAEESGQQGEAIRLYRQAVLLLEANYPASAVLLNAKARLAGYLARSGQLAAAEAMFSDIVHSQPDTSNLPPSFANVLRPYVDLLLKKGEDRRASEQIFAATQLMIRPGLAQTQAVLARELSGGTDEASRLFRQSVTLSRQVERSRIELAGLQDIARPTPQDIVRARVLRATLDSSQQEQLVTQATLASFPKYRAIASDTIALSELQNALKANEAYYRMTIVGDHAYAMMITSDAARAVKLSVTSKELDEQVTALRDTISKVENGKRATYPFDVALAHQLYVELFGPFETALTPVRHLIFEPDGALLRLPIGLLVIDQASADAYEQRAKTSTDAAYDFRGVGWLARERDISTAVSPRSFAQLRRAPPSAGTREYLGLGENTPPLASAKGNVPPSGDRDCLLPLSSWSRPISAKELEAAASLIRQFDAHGVEIVTRDQFTDTGLEARKDLAQYRILHFATHGVVTARAAKCPPQPALLTSFGGPGSDGLLTFKEIFDLHLDADLVILSACDTAGKASSAATAQAGLAGGGDVALDGLVRAFVGAGSRLVIASHWPVPDDFNATQRLISGLFSAPPGTPTVTALRMSERHLMDDVNTSHPFYWAAFAAVGDGEIPVIRPVKPNMAAVGK